MFTRSHAIEELLACIDKLIRGSVFQERFVEGTKILRSKSIVGRPPEFLQCPPPRAGEALGEQLLVRERGRTRHLFDSDQIKRFLLSAEVGGKRNDVSPEPDGWADLGIQQSHLLVELTSNGFFVRLAVLDPTSGSRPQRSFGQSKANEQQTPTFICNDRSHSLAKREITSPNGTNSRSCLKGGATPEAVQGGRSGSNLRRIGYERMPGASHESFCPDALRSRKARACLCMELGVSGC